MNDQREDRALLPIFEEMRAEFGELVRERLDEIGEPPPAAAPAPLPQPRRRPRRAPVMARRVVLAVALICLLAGVAVAAHFTVGGGGSANTKPQLIAKSAGWRLLGWRHGGHLCVELRSGGEVSEGCVPAVGPLRATSVLGGTRRLVGGLDGPRVRSVVIEVGGHRVRAKTRAPIDPATARAAGLPSGSRWFIATFPRAADGPARILARGEGGARLGQPTLDCSLGAAGAACRHAARVAADAALR
jgi:hypothetical protein